ncbi:hypothetical protein MEI_00617 [Bartonella vinsonii subsp. arupensis Pm136co]|uniref:Aspartate/ornithine carbamoyltransferase Asp/Orn-binding domain-containing protein n=1 Tax=Bartonella vinsonii subsp. arupensis Pm136co TaxID=1094561 RepID=A0ABP2QTA1_BARVI|nr:hypothetical protein [Bartonella vinsonii]EJF98118.1 hypothetical protein MEI_00617 [Bartonella vinsonii subsp. arupensis Pm136co]
MEDGNNVTHSLIEEAALFDFHLRITAHCGEEIVDTVINGSLFVVFDEAENRLYIQKAILA